MTMVTIAPLLSQGVIVVHGLYTVWWVLVHYHVDTFTDPHPAFAATVPNTGRQGESSFNIHWHAHKVIESNKQRGFQP